MFALGAGVLAAGVLGVGDADETSGRDEPHPGSASRRLSWLAAGVGCSWSFGWLGDFWWMGDVERAEQPGDGDEKSLTLGWLAFHRDALLSKCHGLSDDQMAARSASPSRLSLLGLVRHMAEMERAYGSWPLGQKREFHWVWGSYEDDAEDDMDCGARDVSVSFSTWQAERSATDEALETVRNLGVVSAVNGRSARWNLAKLLGEYSRHNGHADILRERIDGMTGE